MVVCDLLLPPLGLVLLVAPCLCLRSVSRCQVPRGLDDVQFVSLGQNFGPVLVIFFLFYILVAFLVSRWSGRCTKASEV